MLRLWLYRGEQLGPSSLVRPHGTSCSIFGEPFWAHSQNQTHYVYRIQLLALNNSWTTQNILDFQPEKLNCTQRVKGKPMATFQSVLALPWKAKSWKSSTYRYFHSITKDRDGGNIKFYPVHPTVLRQDQLSFMSDCWLANTNDLGIATFLWGWWRMIVHRWWGRWRYRKIKRFFPEMFT